MSKDLPQRGTVPNADNAYPLGEDARRWSGARAFTVKGNMYKDAAGLALVRGGTNASVVEDSNGGFVVSFTGSDPGAAHLCKSLEWKTDIVVPTLTKAP